MKKIFAIAIFFAAALAAAAFADRFTASKSSITIEGTSTLHDWKIESDIINGEIDAPSIANWKDGGTVVKVAIPVESIKADHGRMTRIMQDALKASQNQQITYELTAAQLQTNNDDSFVVKTKGKLTIAGTTRDIDMNVDGKRLTPTTYMLNGSAPIRMTDYGIKPPVTMMNTLKTGDDVKVSFRWIVQASR